MRRWIATLTLALALLAASLQAQHVRVNGVAVGGGGAPGGANKDVQCNISGTLGACETTLLTFDQATDTLGVGANTTFTNVAWSFGGSTGAQEVLMRDRTSGSVTTVLTNGFAEVVLGRIDAAVRMKSATPTISAGCGSGATIAGTAHAFRVTIGTTPGTCVLNYNVTFPTAPVCSSNNATSAQLSRCSTTTTQVTLAGTIANLDVIHVLSLGF